MSQETSQIPRAMQKRLEIAKRIRAASGGWPESFVKSGVEAMRACPQEKWKELHAEFEAMAPGYELTTAVLLKVTEEVVEQASEEPEAYKNVIELFFRFIKIMPINGEAETEPMRCGFARNQRGYFSNTSQTQLWMRQGRWWIWLMKFLRSLRTSTYKT